MLHIGLNLSYWVQVMKTAQWHWRFLLTLLAPVPPAPSWASFLLIEIFSFMTVLEIHGLRLGWEQGKGDGVWFAVGRGPVLSSVHSAFQTCWVPWRNGSLATWWSRTLRSCWGLCLLSPLHLPSLQFLAQWAHSWLRPAHLCQERRKVAMVMVWCSHQFLLWLLVAAILHYSLR